MITTWILVIALSAPCSDYRCSDSVAISQVGPFYTQESCMTAANLAIKTFSVNGRQARAMCAPNR